MAIPRAIYLVDGEKSPWYGVPWENGGFVIVVGSLIYNDWST